MAFAYGMTVDVEVEGKRQQWPLAEVPTMGAALARLDLPRDALVHMYRTTYQTPQQIEIDACRLQVEQLTSVNYRARDVLARQWTEKKRALLALVEKLVATGQVNDYAPFDALRLTAEPFMDRTLRPGDRLVVSTEPQVIWMWDAGRGFRQRPHGPAKSAAQYGGGAIASGDARGDLAYWVGPRGEFAMLGVARYNRADRPIPPGSILFFPPPGFGRSEQAAFQCIARALRYQDTSQFVTGPWWSR